MNETPTPQWVPLAEFGARWEAQLLIDRLEADGIPTLVRGPETGIYGPGMAGPTPLGVTLLVPDDALDRARELLD